MSLADELKKLRELYESGALTDAEYEQAKAAAMHEPPAASSSDHEAEARQWAMFLHLSLLAGFVVPLGGLILPIVLWQIKKEEFPIIDEHGKIVVNWIISELIYAAIGIVLIFVLVGVAVLLALGVLGIIFPIIGALKANEGKLWPYPLCIRFLK